MTTTVRSWTTCHLLKQRNVRWVPCGVTGRVMGCKQAKVMNDPAVGNGKMMLDNASPRPSVVLPEDPRSPLGSRQMFKLKQSWKGIKRRMEETGVEMFLR